MSFPVGRGVRPRRRARTPRPNVRVANSPEHFGRTGRRLEPGKWQRLRAEATAPGKSGAVMSLAGFVQMVVTQTPSPLQSALAEFAEPGGSRKHLSVDIAGGGPVGLLLALLLIEYMGDKVRIRLFDHRWWRDGNLVRFRDASHGNRRRPQVVTLQSNVWTGLPRAVQQALFESQEFSEMWPYGPDSPKARGRPRNLAIQLIEDRLLEIVQRHSNAALYARRYSVNQQPTADVLAICEGARSATRDSLNDYFGRPHPDMYRLNGERLIEVVLGMQVDAVCDDGLAVLLTVCQNRWLLNARNGRGFLNMRLTDEEASELAGVGEHGPVECLQGRPCTMLRDGVTFRCPTHGTLFKPSIDGLSFLWPRMEEGLRLFGMDRENLRGVTAFRFEMLHRPRFFTRLPSGTFACLLGDAALSIHFWPGRGLNTGAKSADSLARCLARRYAGRSLRPADLDEHEGVMQMLQSREVHNRAWETMLMRENGVPRPIRERIARGLTGPCDRAELVREMMHRATTIRERLADRMGPLPDDQELRARLGAVSARTLNVLVESGPWVTEEVGGPEVDVEALLPLPKR